MPPGAKDKVVVQVPVVMPPPVPRCPSPLARPPLPRRGFGGTSWVEVVLAGLRGRSLGGAALELRVVNAYTHLGTYTTSSSNDSAEAHHRCNLVMNDVKALRPF